MQMLPKLGEKLTKEHLEFLEAFSLSCRHSIIAMLKNSQSGHPGGSLSMIDYLTLLYTFVIGQTGEKVVVSNGHVSPAVYGVLAEMGWIPKEKVIETFRKRGSIYEGHVTRHVDGVHYGTGPLGIGVSVGAAFALGKKMKKSGEKVYATVGDGESQEGQIHEMVHLAAKYKLDNYILFVDYNKVQLSGSLDDIMPISEKSIFGGTGWHIINVDGHNYQEMWDALHEAHQIKGKPVVIIGNTIMGKGVDYMEADGRAHKANWHGKAPKPDEADKALAQLVVSDEKKKLIEDFRNTHVKWKPQHSPYPPLLSKVEIDEGEPTEYDTETLTDCRTAYGKALLDLVKRNDQVMCLSADLRGSVMTKFVIAELPERHVECGVAEQNMMSMAGGFSHDGYIPFCSTFGAFMSSRAKDQARVNDINYTNVKMVATHCGLSVGEDGPTHQAIDDMGSFLGMFNTMIIEPADPNQCDRIIRYVASHYGNFYVRMGRHKFPVLTKEDGSLFYDKDYKYEYGKTDVIREGDHITIAASGAMIGEAIKARESLMEKNPEVSIEIIAVSSIKKFDDTILKSIRKTKKVLTVEDHNTISGLGGQLARHLAEINMIVDKYKMIGVEEYQLSGKHAELYEDAGMSADHIEKACLELLK